jgi:hypothetical protein
MNERRSTLRMIAGSERFRSFSSYFAMRERRGDLAEELVASSVSSLRRPTSPTAEPAVSPWLEEQGHAPLAWPVLGAIANATNRIGLMTAVTCPLMRYHPAVSRRSVGHVAKKRRISGNNKDHRKLARQAMEISDAQSVDARYQ